MLQKVQLAQNKILSIINFKCLKDRVKASTLYKEMKILQIKDIFEIEVAKFMHSFHHGNLPCIFDNYYKSVATQHNHNTRSIANKKLRCSTAKFKQKCQSTFPTEFFPVIPNLQPVFVHHVRFKRYFKFF